jgi:hypothetical protein
MHRKRATPDESTDREEKTESHSHHLPDQQPTDEQEAAADEFRDEHLDEMERVGRHHREMDEIGAQAKGEGRVS